MSMPDGSPIGLLAASIASLHGDVTGAQILYRKPSGASDAWAADVSGTTVTYTTIDGDIDEAGTWELQAYVVLAAWTGSSTAVKTKVGELLATPAEPAP